MSVVDQFCTSILGCEGQLAQWFLHQEDLDFDTVVGCNEVGDQAESLSNWLRFLSNCEVTTKAIRLSSLDGDLVSDDPANNMFSNSHSICVIASDASLGDYATETIRKNSDAPIVVTAIVTENGYAVFRTEN